MSNNTPIIERTFSCKHCAAFYVPVAIYGLVSLALSLSKVSALPSLALSPLLKFVLGNFSLLSRFHHATLNIAFVCTIIPALSFRVPRFARDHLLEASFMASLSLDVVLIYLQFATHNPALQVTTFALSVALILLGALSSKSVLQINLVQIYVTWQQEQCADLGGAVEAVPVAVPPTGDSNDMLKSKSSWNSYA
ncbi:hypothetical protein CYMTET_9246 [Cymbomonas tetramitiformis]|uniref:Transmembrane protein n=1 Tax=Cymbomonas tetramitiformis TaxID=36881 RepID=A0AAE0LFB0_9CHLO|nr:hypothetical protein CYMTET_9246 [Cymbomonas tetramitiformis]